MKQKIKIILFLVIRVGYNTPAIIKYSFWDMALKNENSIYASVNLNDSYAPDNLKERSICINDDISKVLEYIKVKKLVVILDITTKTCYYYCNNSYYNSLIKENILHKKEN